MNPDAAARESLMDPQRVTLKVVMVDDDIVVVEKRQLASVGDIVVAIVDGEFTLKTLGREKGRFVLYPANKAYPVIRPEGQLEIFGVVVGQFRKYT